jgi:hypothetical protein
MQGIDDKTMFYLEPQLRQIQGVQAIHRHRHTPTAGRWSLVTTDHFFNAVRKILEENLQPWVDQYCNESNHMIDPNFPPVSLAFKKPVSDAESTGSYDTYLSACATIYSNITMDDFPDFPPQPFDDLPQEWEMALPTRDTPQPRTPREHPSPSTHEQTVSLSQFQSLQEANATMAQTIRELQSQLQLLSAQINQTGRIAQSQSPIQTSESAQAAANMSMNSGLSLMSHDSK